jgi:hypothetical protein
MTRKEPSILRASVQDTYLFFLLFSFLSESIRCVQMTSMFTFYTVIRM